MRSGIVGLALALAAGCALDIPDGDQDVETSSIESAVTVLPVEGFWFYDENAPIATTCNSGVPRTEDGLFFISHIDATTYRVFPGDDRPSFVCTMTDAKFTCPDRFADQVDIFGLDAVLTFQVSATGVYSDTRHGVGKQDVLVTCSGTQCGALAPMPCGYVHNFDVVAL